jgi:hypothetical protein
MVLADLVLGWLLHSMLTKKSPVAQPPLLVSPGATAATPVQTTTPALPATPPAPTPAPAAPIPAPVAPAPAPAIPATTPAPSFPTPAAVPAEAATTAASPTVPSSGMKRAVEVWQIKQNLQTMIVGVLATHEVKPTATTTSSTITSLEQTFPTGWQPCTNVTLQEMATAKSLLPKWHKGGVVFMGSMTLASRRAYRMTEHKATAAQPAAIPVSTTVPAPAAPKPPPAPAPVAVPAPAPVAVPTPAPVATPAPVVTVAPAPPAPAPVAVPAPAPSPPPPAEPTKQITTVRQGEGLAQVAKRLGFPENRDSVLMIREANVPSGPDANWAKADLSKGGLKKEGRKVGMQPGDHLWVPTAWSPVDASRL